MAGIRDFQPERDKNRRIPKVMMPAAVHSIPHFGNRSGDAHLRIVWAAIFPIAINMIGELGERKRSARGKESCQYQEFSRP